MILSIIACEIMGVLSMWSFLTQAQKIGFRKSDKSKLILSCLNFILAGIAIGVI